MRVTKREDQRGAQAKPHNPLVYEMSPVGVGDALEELTARLIADAQDPMELATRYALLVERARTLRQDMDRVSSAVDCASQALASRLSKRALEMHLGSGSVADLMAEAPGQYG